MKVGDRIIQLWRIQVAAQWILWGSRVLDIGCHQGEFLLWLGERIRPSIGLDPLYKGNVNSGRHQFFACNFQESLISLEVNSFDAIVLLATIEHIDEKSVIAREAAKLLCAGGRVIITVPSPLVDKILNILIYWNIVDGMSLEEHHGFRPDDLPAIFFPEGFKLKTKKQFQFGLNNLYVFERMESSEKIHDFQKQS
jgi:2-polyprenyl-3-methyl-5-hydroxy-6-metoxy-1,4-benzoquinol methylase